MANPKGKPRGYFEKILVLDAETTGIAFGNVDASYNKTTGESFQAISWGFIVADAETLKPIEKLYLEIQWDKESTWSVGAQKVHGLTKKHLEQHGMTSEEAAVELMTMLLKYWSADNCICTMGHNHISFDLWFLRRWLEPLGIMPKLGNRHIDTNGVGFITFKSYNSDDLFNAAGLPDRDPSKHNALTDAEHTLEAARRIRVAFQSIIN